MNYTEHKISLDVHNAMSRVVLRMKKGDSRRRLRVHLSENGYPYHISEDCYAVFTAMKPDGKVVFNNCSIDGCAIIYDVTEQTTAVEGVLNCEIQVYGAENGLLTSASFTIIVEDTVYDKETEVESTSEFNALTDLISEVQELKKELEEGNNNQGGGIGGTTDHSKLSNRDAADQHPIEAIVGLSQKLKDLGSGSSGIHVGPDEPTDESIVVWIDPESEGTSVLVEAPGTANVGQTIAVKTVDENGVPVEWQAADLPDSYTKAQIDAIMGAYINDIDALIGGDS